MTDLERLELAYLAKQYRPIWGAHLKRGEPLPDNNMKRWLVRGWMKQVGLQGYVITNTGREALASIR